MTPQPVRSGFHLTKVQRHFFDGKINIERCDLLSEDQQMLDKEQVAVNSILKNEQNVFHIN